MSWKADRFKDNSGSDDFRQRELKKLSKKAKKELRKRRRQSNKYCVPVEEARANIPKFMLLSGQNFHHIPPRNPDPRPVTLTEQRGGRYVSQNEHAAYHVLFHAAKSREDCIRILDEVWWPQT